MSLEALRQCAAGAVPELKVTLSTSADQLPIWQHCKGPNAASAPRSGSCDRSETWWASFEVHNIMTVWHHNMH